jgi:hypothetical protein
MRLATDGIASQIIRFARYPIRQPSDHARNVAFGPDQNAQLWSP